MAGNGAKITLRASKEVVDINREILARSMPLSLLLELDSAEQKLSIII